MFGQDLLPDFDIANANFLLSFGADFLSTWGSSTRLSTAYGEFRQGAGRQERGTLVQVDPRFSLTAANADRWLPIKPGMEGYLALSLAYVIISEGLQAPGVDVGALTDGQGAAALEAYRPETVAAMLELPPQIHEGHSAAEFVRELAHDFAGHRPSIAIGGDSAGAHTNGLFNLQAIYALNYLVGSVGETGGIRFNPGSPLRELPATANVGSLQDWAEVANSIRSGQTRLVLLHDADPVHGLPASVDFAGALNRDEVFIVSFSPFLNETSILADLILPDRVFLEDWGDDIPEPGPGHQIIGMQQPVVNPLSDLDPRSFGDLMLSMAQEMGQESALPWSGVEAALRESVDRLFDLNRGTSREVDSAGALWSLMLQQGGWWSESDTGPTPNAPGGLLNQIAASGSEPGFSGSGDYYLLPFAHNSLLDGRNAHLPWMQAVPDPITTITWQTWVEINHRHAAELNLREGDVVRIESADGNITALVYPNPALPPNVVAVPLGQGRHSGSQYVSGSDPRESSNVMDLLSPRQTAETGALAWAANRVRIVPTGESLKVSKFEGSFPAREIAISEGEEIIKTTDH